MRAAADPTRLELEREDGVAALGAEEVDLHT